MADYRICLLIFEAHRWGNYHTSCLSFNRYARLDEVENIIAAVEAKADEFNVATEHIDFVGPEDDVRRIGCWLGEGRDQVRVLASPEWEFTAFAHLIHLDERLAVENLQEEDSEQVEVTEDELEAAIEEAREQFATRLSNIDTLKETYLRIYEAATSGGCELIPETLDSYQIVRCRTQERLFPYNEPTTTPTVWKTYRKVRTTGQTIREIILAKYPVGQLSGGEEQEEISGPTAFQ